MGARREGRLSLRRQQTEHGGSNVDRPRCLLVQAPTLIFHSLVFVIPSLGDYGPAVFELCHSRRTVSASLRLPRRPRCSLLRELVNQAHYAFAPSDFRSFRLPSCKAGRILESSAMIPVHSRLLRLRLCLGRLFHVSSPGAGRLTLCRWTGVFPSGNLGRPRREPRLQRSTRPSGRAPARRIAAEPFPVLLS